MKLGHRFPKLNIAVAAVLAFLFIVGAACERNGGDSATETPTPVASAPTPSPTALPTESPTPTPTALPTATPTPAPLSGAEIFSRVSPNIPVVITGSGLGSGVLIPGGFIVTNAHVVWGYPNVLVKFPNSNTHRTLPVVGLDLMADLAVIGPVNVLPEGLELEDGEDLAVGSDVYLVGYPDEVDVFPDKPTISRGVISRFRQWRTLDLTLIQSDAATGGGQSGGVMVSEHGEVIGITTKMFGDGSFIIATSAADIRERVDGLIQGRDVDGLRDRRLPSRGATEHEFKLTDRWHSKIAVLYEREDTEIEIRLEGEADSAFAVADISGELILDVDDSESGVEWGSTTLETLGPHFVLFEQFSSDPGEFALETSHNLIFIDDKDDHRRVSVNESIIGNIDAPLDEDYFELQLDAGESVTIKVESFMIDPYVSVARADWNKSAVYDDDGGGGVFGWDAYVSFTAPESGMYIILVSDFWVRNVGGYFLKIDGAPRRAVSPPPTATPVPRPVASPHGLMATYANAEYGFSIQYPADWLSHPVENEWEGGDESLFGSDDDEFLIISIHDLPRNRVGHWTFDDYVDFWVTWIESDAVGGKITANVEYGHIDGLPTRLIFYASNGTLTALHIFVSESNIGYAARYELNAPPAEETIRMVEYSLGTFTVQGQPLRHAPEFPSLDSVSSGDTQSPPESSQQQNAFGPLATYRDDQFAFSIEYPASWQAVSPGRGWTAVFESDRGEALRIAIDRDWDGLNQWNAYREAASLIEYYKSRDDRVQALSHLRYGYIDGLPARLLVVGTDPRLSAALVYISEDGARYTVGYFLSAPWFDELAPLFEYSFHSIIIDGKPLIGAPKFPSLDSASSDDAQPSPESSQMQSPFGQMATYRDDKFAFSIQYPADWEEATHDSDFEIRFLGGDDYATWAYWREDLPSGGSVVATLDRFVDRFVAEWPSTVESLRVVSNSRFGEIDGRPAQLIVGAANETGIFLVVFVHLLEDGTAHFAILEGFSSYYDELAPLFDYMLNSITIYGNPLINTPDFPRVQ